MSKTGVPFSKSMPETETVPASASTPVHVVKQPNVRHD